MAFDPGLFGGALLHLLFGLLFALLTVYVGIRIFERTTPQVDELAEIRRGNVAVGILLAGVVLALATVVRPPIDRLTASFLAVGGGTMEMYARTVGTAFVQLVVALALASVAIRAALWVFDQVTQGLDEEAEIRDGNVAVAILMAGILFAVASVVAGAVNALAATLTL